MNDRIPSFLLALLFLLIMIFGSLQPKTVFACAMMDTVILYECCCDNHKADEDCVDSSCDAMLDPNRGPCCERSVEISINEDARQDTPLVKPVEIRSDVDPPQASITNSFDTFFLPLMYAGFHGVHRFVKLKYETEDKNGKITESEIQPGISPTVSKVF